MYLLTSIPEGAIFKYSLTSFEFKIALTLDMSTVLYERTLSGIKTEKN